MCRYALSGTATLQGAYADKNVTRFPKAHHSHPICLLAPHYKTPDSCRLPDYWPSSPVLRLVMSTTTTPEPTNDTKVYLPLPPPDTLHSENPQKDLTEAEKTMYDTVFAHFTAADYKLPGFDSQNEGPDSQALKEKAGFTEGERRNWMPQLIEEEKFWLSYECILRCVTGDSQQMA